MANKVIDHIDSQTHGIPGDRKSKPHAAGVRNMNVTQSEHTGLKGGTRSAAKAGKVSINLGWGQTADQKQGTMK